MERRGKLNKPRIVLDTNVWLDWLVFDDPSAAPIREALEEKRAEVAIDAACESELERALGYDFGARTLDAAARAACLERCRSIAVRIGAAAPAAERRRLPSCRDAHDQKFLEAALAARARFLVTRDRALLELSRRKYALPFRIATPEGFAGARSRPLRRPRAAPLRR